MILETIERIYYNKRDKFEKLCVIFMAHSFLFYNDNIQPNCFQNDYIQN